VADSDAMVVPKSPGDHRSIRVNAPVKTHKKFHANTQIRMN